MQHALDRGHLLAALVGGAGGHHRLLVPAEPAGDLRQRLGLALKRHHVLVCGHLAPRIEATTGYCARWRARRIITQTATAPNWWSSPSDSGAA